MQLTDILSLLGGLALFLFGMKLMSDSLEAAAGKRLKSILERLTSRPINGVLVGTGLTAIIQSSSATTVMVVGFVNAGLMTLSQAISVVMGANIGTTITAQMIALDIGVIAPILAIAGVCMGLFFKKRSLIYAGQIIAGLGILFIGMGMMSDAMQPLRNDPFFIQAISTFSNPLIGILVGAVFTGIIQSSSASIGILQAIAMTGVMDLSMAVYVLFGMNIGTCITSLLASIGANKNAKRVSLVHLIFNIIGTIVFTVICLLSPLTNWVASWTPANVTAQIANMHTLFNVVTTLMLFPFIRGLANLAIKILPDKDRESDGFQFKFIEEHNFGSVSVCIANLFQEIKGMLQIARANVRMAISVIRTGSDGDLECIQENEEYLDKINAEITRYMARVTTLDMPLSDAKTINSLFRITGDIERIGDHAENIAEYQARLSQAGISLSPEAIAELARAQEKLDQEFDALEEWRSPDSKQRHTSLTNTEEEVDVLIEQFRTAQINRVCSGQSDANAAVIYSELLSDIERISDHMQNIADAFYRSRIDFKREN